MVSNVASDADLAIGGLIEKEVRSEEKIKPGS